MNRKINGLSDRVLCFLALGVELRAGSGLGEGLECHDVSYFMKVP